MRHLLPFVPLFAACAADYEMVNHDPLASPAPGITLTPSQLVFPESVEGEAITRSVTVENHGTADLWLDTAQILGEGTFWLASFPQEAIEPGGQAAIDIGFVPTGEPLVESVLQVFPTDTTLDSAMSELVGTWGTPDLEVWPRTLSYGEHRLDCPEERTVWLVNHGTRTVTVSEIILESGGFALDEVPELPLTLAPDESVPVSVTFTPVARGEVEATLLVVSDDPEGPTLAPLSGSGTADGQCVIIEEGGTATNTLDVSASFAFADVAFVLDTSGSMGDTLSALSDEVADISESLHESIDDITFGLATYEDYHYSGTGDDEDRPFVLRAMQSPGVTALQSALASTELHNGLDRTEATIEALYQAASGMGYDQDCDGEFDAETDVLPLRPHRLDAFAGLEEGHLSHETTRLGGMGFRDGVLPILVFATDDMARNPDLGDRSPGGCSTDARIPALRRAMGRIGAGVVGIAVDREPGDEVFNDLLSVVGPQGVLVPWSPDDDDSTFREVVVAAIEEMIAGQVLAEVHLEVVEDEYGLVESISPEQHLHVVAHEEIDFSVTWREALPADVDSVEVTFDLVSGTTRLQRIVVEVRVP